MNSSIPWLRFAFRAIKMCWLIAALVGSPSAPAEPAGSTSLDTFAKCIAQNTTMYGSFVCSHCDDQKKLFGDSFKHVRYVECSVPGGRQMTPACQAAQIRFTPTWIFADSERRTGVQSLKQLSDKTGCPLP